MKSSAFFLLALIFFGFFSSISNSYASSPTTSCKEEAQICDGSQKCCTGLSCQKTGSATSPIFKCLKPGQDPGDPIPTAACVKDGGSCSSSGDKCCEGTECINVGSATSPQFKCGDPSTASKDKEKPTPPPPPKPPCGAALDADGKCTSFNTALGPLSTVPGMFVTKVFAVLLSLAGGIALLLIIKAGYQLMTSSGKPEALQAGREQLFAAIVGLLFLIFSFVILQVIGVDILKIPEF